ncbi:MAG: hypothetical protein GY871_13525 [Actinomycetales bacterium]|nr:hypothetical protein [Actinomycetales bacterium]MCP4894582.1 hypothetical protein [Actinomycetales bacterium]
MICHNCGGEGRHIAWCNQYRPGVIYSNTTPRARNTDPTTSHQAAASVAPDTLTRTQALILEALRAHGPLTDEQLCQRIAQVERKYLAVSGIRTRRSELVKAGRVIDTGDRQPMLSGRPAIVWGIA